MTASAKLLSTSVALALALIIGSTFALTSGPGEPSGNQVVAGTAKAAETSAVKGTFKSAPDLDPPRMNVKMRSSKAINQKLFVGFKDRGAAIYSPNGQPIWFLPSRSINFRVQKFRGKPVLTWFQAATKGSGLKRNTYIIANRNYKVIKRVLPGNGLSPDSHEFKLTNRGTAFLTSYKSTTRNLSSVGMGTNAPVADSIAQEIDLRTGKVVWEWRSLDHVPIRDTFAEKLRRPGASFDYFHINSIEDAPDGNILISGRSTNAVYKVSRKTGRVMWTLGGKSSDFEMGKGAYFSSQHDANLQKGNKISIYDNGDSPVISKPVRGQSRGLVLKLNYRKMKATVLKSYLNPAKPLASQQGNMQNLKNGHYLLGWGGVPLISEHAAGGKMLFDAAFEDVGSFYRAYRSPWHGRPKTRVSVAANVTDNARTRIWVSWNGDSAVRRWKVMAGKGKNSLKKVANRTRKGFETTIGLSGRYRYVKIYGLSGSGKKIGTSRLIKSG